MFCPAPTSSCPAWPVEMPSSAVVRGDGAADQPLELLVERGDLLVEGLDAPRERAQREAGGLRGELELARGGPQPAAEARLAADRHALGELLAQRLGSSDDQVL